MAKDVQGDFFAVDARAWQVACGLGLNETVAYLILARGSGGDQRTTSWSIHSIEKYTGVSRPRGDAAIKRLIETKLVRKDLGGSRPRYFILPAHEVPTSEAYATVRQLVFVDGISRREVAKQLGLSIWPWGQHNEANVEALD